MRKGRSKIKVHEDSSALPPGVCYFPSGIEGLDPNGQTTAYSKKGTKHHMIVRKQDQVEYVGTTLRRPSEDSFVPCRHFVGVFNKKKGKLSILPMLGQQPFRMEPKLDCVEYGKSDLATDFGDGNMNSWKGRKRLFLNFGAAKAQRSLRDLDQFQVDANALNSAPQIGKMASSIGLKAQEEGTTREQIFQLVNQNRNLPPHDPEATVAHEAYKFEAICPPFIWEELPTQPFLEAASDSMGGSLMMEKGWSGYVESQLKSLRTGDEAEIKRKAIIVSFLTTLLKLLNMPRVIFSKNDMDISTQAARHDIKGRGIIDFLLKKFYSQTHLKDRSKFERSPENRNLIILYIWVLALHLEAFDLGEESVNLVCLDVKISPEKASRQLKELGCNVSQVGFAKMAVKYRATLLQGEMDPNLRLKDCFPAIDVNLRKRKRRTL